MDLAILDLLPRARHMFCQNTSLACQWLECILCPKISQVAFGLSHHDGCDFRASAYHECREIRLCSEPCLAGYFFCLDSVFHLLVPPRDCFFAIIRNTESFPSTCCAWAADEAIAWLFWTTVISRNKGNTLSAKVFLTSLSNRASHFIR